MGIPINWPETATVYLDKKFLDTAILDRVALEYRGRPLPSYLIALSEQRRLWLDRSEKKTERRNESGEIISIDVQSVWYDLTTIPKNRDFISAQLPSSESNDQN